MCVYIYILGKNRKIWNEKKYDDFYSCILMLFMGDGDYFCVLCCHF